MSRIGWERIEDLELKEEEDVGLRNRLRFLRILIIMSSFSCCTVFGGFNAREGRNWHHWPRKTRRPNYRLTPRAASSSTVMAAPLAINQPSFNVTITPAFLPDEENERQAVFERLSLLTGVPVSNTLQQKALVEAANPELVSTYSRLANIYGASVEETLDQVGVVPQTA